MPRTTYHLGIKVPQHSEYLQIHPLKLLIDWAAGLVALYFFWERQLLLALLVSIVLPWSSPAFSSASRAWNTMQNPGADGS